MSLPKVSLHIGTFLCVAMTATTLNQAQAAESQHTKSAERLITENRPLVIAHRGYSAVAPENTLPAFQLALAAGADLVELDYHHSKDGIPIVIHDHELDRTTDGDERWQSKKVR